MNEIKTLMTAVNGGKGLTLIVRGNPGKNGVLILSIKPKVWEEHIAPKEKYVEYTRMVQAMKRHIKKGVVHEGITITRMLCQVEDKQYVETRVK